MKIIVKSLKWKIFKIVDYLVEIFIILMLFFLVFYYF